jgi:hypothetical protein
MCGYPNDERLFTKVEEALLRIQNPTLLPGLVRFK